MQKFSQFLKEKIWKHCTWLYKSFPKCPALQPWGAATLQCIYLSPIWLSKAPVTFSKLQRSADILTSSIPGISVLGQQRSQELDPLNFLSYRQTILTEVGENTTKSMMLQRFLQSFQFHSSRTDFVPCAGWISPCCVNTDELSFLPIGNRSSRLGFRSMSDTLKNKYLPPRPTFQPLKDKVGSGRTGLEAT